NQVMSLSVKAYFQQLTDDQDLQAVLAGTNFLYAGQEDKTPFYVHALTVNSYLQSAYRCNSARWPASSAPTVTTRGYIDDRSTSQHSGQFLARTGRGRPVRCLQQPANAATRDADLQRCKASPCRHRAYRGQYRQRTAAGRPIRRRRPHQRNAAGVPPGGRVREIGRAHV